MLSLFILVPFCVLVAINLPLGRWVRAVAIPSALVLGLVQAAAVLAKANRGVVGPGPLEDLLGFPLRADSLTWVLLLSIGIVVSTAAAAAQSSLLQEKGRLNFASLLLLSLTAMNGVVLLTDVFSLYVFLEITSICSFILIAFDRRREALEGSLKYLLLSAVATGLMLFSVGLLVWVAGGTSFETVAAALKAAEANWAARIAIGLFTAGLFIKGGVVPFHGWLPGAYTAAPASVSVLLAGIVTKVSGIYGILRLAISVFPPSVSLNEILLLAGAASMVMGALAALRQKDIKGLLAYSSISQVGYIILGLGCGTPLGVAAAILHLFNHSIFKSLLFINAAAVEQSTGTTDMSRLGGLGSRMPATSTTSVIGLLSTAGIPPFSGFWSKLLMVVALWQAQHYGYAVLAAMLSVITLAYLLTMHRRVFFGKTAESLLQIREAPIGVVLPAVVLALVTLAVGLLFPWIYNTFLCPVGGLG